MEEVAREWAFQARLKFIQFQRCVWMYESLLFMIAVIIAYVIGATTQMALLLLTYVFLRVVTEALNYDHVARAHNVHNPWRFLYPFV